MNNNNRWESFVVYGSFEQNGLPEEERLAIYDAIFAYGLRQEQPVFADVHLVSIWKLIVPQLDANIKRRLNGKLGGAPKGNRNAQKNNQKQPKNNQKQPNVNVNDNDNVNDIIAADGSATAAHSNNTRFVKPSLEQVEEYCRAENIQIDAVRFMDYYESVGWKVGKNKPMKDWRAAVRTWRHNDNNQYHNDNNQVCPDVRFNFGGSRQMCGLGKFK